MTSSVTILLLDEEPILRRATALMLSNRGGVVSVAASLDEASALAEGHAFDVAILDVSADGPSAAEILDRLRLGGNPPRRLVVCGTEPLREQEDAAVVLQKPYPFDSLLSAVFGSPVRRRPARSGVFARVRAGSARAQRALTSSARSRREATRRAARAWRDRG